MRATPRGRSGPTTGGGRRVRVLITGASGFVGGHLAARRASLGDEVHVLVRPSSSREGLQGIDCTVHVHDGSLRGLIAIAEAAAPDVCFHLAARFVAEHRTADVDALVSDNLVFGTHLLEALDLAGCRRLVSAGTSWQRDESGSYAPVCLYAAMKQAFEDLAMWWVSARGLRCVVLHLFDSYGPRDRRGKLFGALDRAIASRRPLAMSPGEQQLDLVYIDDLVRALGVAADRTDGSAGALERFGASSGERRTLREVVELYGEIRGSQVPVDWGGRPYREREVMVPWDGEPTLPGWTPEVSLREGLARMVTDGR